MRRIDAGPLLVLLGAGLMLISLFSPWYEPELSAWDVFEVVDLLLAALALAAAYAAAALLRGVPSPAGGRLPWLAAGAVLLVIATLLDRPPVVGDGDVEVGLWLALAGAAVLAAGALLGLARVSVSFAVAPREPRARVSAVDARDVSPAAAAGEKAPEPSPPLFRRASPGATDETEPTQPLAPAPDGAAGDEASGKRRKAR